MRVAVTLALACMLAGYGCRREDSAAASPAAARNTPPTRLGVNLNTIAFWDGSRPFMNLIYGSDWQMKGPAGGGDVPASNLDANGWVKSLPVGNKVVRILSIPAASGEILCRWQGEDHGSMSVDSDGVTSNTRRTSGANELRFRYVSGYPDKPNAASLSFTVDPANYVRNIDCREASAPPRAVFDPSLVSALQGFRVVRFMKWQPAVEANGPVTWATRNKPGDGSYLTNDGVPVEQMIALANQVRADPWFAMPWNADDDYVRRFATYVRDHLAPGRQAYVEVSNEVWNGGYPVMRQAQDEGKAEGLDPSNGDYGQAMYRYAEKTEHVMGLWSKVFAGQANRLVRVASAQNVSPFWSGQILGYRDTAKSIDALATAPYWAFMDSDYSGQSVDQILDTILPARIRESLDWATQQKAVARKYGKRYIAYEGGQHVWLNKNPEIVAQIERDPRMAKLYASYLTQWNNKIGGTLALFALTGGIGNAGFGLVEYAGQPVAQAPKMRAVRASAGIRPTP